ncbi:hypothetical protein ABFA07_014872 [Porites harrisoni]
MDLKIRMFLLLTVLGIAVYHVQANKMCDWPRGTCTYIYDPCPPNWERCPQYDYDCPVKTNHCCCRKRIPSPDTPPPKPKTKPQPNVCDWPRGTCTYIYDPCPPDWERCPQYDSGCKLATNHCCCRKRRPITPYTPPPTPKPKPQPNVCDWPRGTCTYIYDPCPPDWERCPQYDSGCTLATNHCCCRKRRPIGDAPLKCDWPTGVCSYNKDPCPPGTERCSQRDKGCKLDTNYCCCRTNKQTVKDVPKVKVLAKPCDWPNGTCTYTGDPCPPTWKRCPELDDGCSLPTNHCCCRTTAPPPPGKCDWPRGTCTYYKDPCPPNWERCPDFDIDCELKTNHCCCRKQ